MFFVDRALARTGDARERPSNDTALRFIVIVQHAPVGQRHVGDEMMPADDSAHRKIRNRRVDMRDEVQPAWAEP